MNKWKILESKQLIKNKWVDISEEKVILPNGKEIDYYLNNECDWVSVFAVTEDEKVILNYQYKHGCQEVAVEMPAGYIEKGEKPEEAVRRELMEETGYGFERLELLGKYIVSPTRNRNHCYLYIAFGAKKVSEPENDPSEDIIFKLVKLDELLEKLRSGEANVIGQVGFMYKALDKLGKLKFNEKR